MLYPLDVLYARAGVTEPAVRPTTAERVPPPYRGLLVHQNEMTSTLEAHFGGPVTVRVLSSFSKGQSYFRRVLLVLEGTGTPVAMGAIIAATQVAVYGAVVFGAGRARSFLRGSGRAQVRAGQTVGLVLMAGAVWMLWQGLVAA